MVRNRIVYIILAVACVAFSMLYTSKISAFLMMTVLLYPVAAAGFTAVQLIFIKADFNDKRVSVEKNTPFEFFINIKNNSIFPCAPVEMVCRLPDVDSGLFIEKHVYTSLSPFGQARLAIEGKHIYRGCYSSVIKKVSAIDPLRIIRISKKVNDECVMVFLPRKIELENVVSSTVGEQNFARPSPITAEKEDFSHVRDYRAGDIIQLVHWKLTAKQDELMIKQFDSINDKRAIVLCDRGGSDGDVLLRTDTIIETAIAFVHAALESGVHSKVDLGGFSVGEPVNITNVGEFDRFFELMSVLSASAEPYDFVSVIDNTDISGAAVIVLITANLTDEMISRAKALSEVCAVYLAYVNLAAKPVENELYEEEFMFLNIRGSGEEALRLAAAMASKEEGG